MWFTRVSLHNPVFATMVMLAFVVLGLFSLNRLEVDQFPSVDLPVVVVTTEYPGAAPAIVESEVTKKIEEAVNSIAGINSLYSRTYEGLSVVIIEFQLYVDGRTAADDVREKIGQVQALLRDEVEEPAVQRFDPESLPIWAVAVLPQAVGGGDGAAAPSSVQTTNWADQVLKKRLENVRGVGAVNLVGATHRQIHLNLRPADLDALGVTPDQVMAAVHGENQDQPLGTLQDSERELVVQLPGRLRRPADFNRIIVARSGAGTPIYLQDVATVADAAEEPESLALYNGRRTVLASVQKTQDANTIQVVDDLNAALQGLQDAVPAGLQLVQVNDSSRPIRVAVKNVRETLIEGAGLTVLIVFLFLNSWRSTIITGLTLPISIIGTFFFMQLFGFTVNLITLMALSLCVGLLIDDAIVVRENIVRHGQMGKNAWDAAMDGTREIGLAVLATTLSIVAVFLPIGFMQGIIGKFFHEFGITIVAAVLISMFVAFTLDPMLSSVWHDPAIHRDPAAPRHTLYDRTLGRLTAAFDRFTDRLAQGYQWLLRHALAHRFPTLLVTVAIFALSVGMLRLLGTEFVPKADFSETTFAFYTPQGSSLEATETKARRVSQIIRSQPEVVDTLASINTAAAQGKTSASIHVRLKPRSERRRGAEELAGDLRQRLMAVPGITLTQSGLLEPVGGQKQIEFSLQGPDQQQLERLAAPLMRQFARIPGLVDLDSSSKPGKPTVDVVVRPDAASSLGLSAAQVAAPLRTLIAGTTVGAWRAPDDQTYDIIARLAPQDRRTAQDLQRLPLIAGVDAGGQPVVVRLNQVADLVRTTQTNQINRRGMLREIEFTGNSYGRGVGEISADIRHILDQAALPPGYSYSFSGATKNMEESFSYALQALALAVIFIYMILASQFKSFIQPLALMTALPLTLIGVVIALLLFGSSMSMFSIIGIIMLMGLVTKNAILLVDFAIRAREGRAGDGRHVQPLPRDQALLAAARVRLRPILMTTLAMVFGMMPLAFAASEGAEQRAPMGQAVIGGVITSSLLTLVVVPVVYCYLDDLAAWLGRRLRRAPRDSAPGARD